MIKILILEDEPAALNRLKRLITVLRPDYEIVGDADTVDEGIALLSKYQPDLILSDIQLADGLSFEVFKKSQTKCPIIFITAFDKYAIKAFDFNGVHYILKPITELSLHTALQKFENNPHFIESTQAIHDLIEKDAFTAGKRILSKVGVNTKIVDAQNVAIVYSENKINRIVTFEGKTHSVEYTLDELISELPDHQFFKISRQMIINLNAVVAWKPYSSNRLILQTNPEIDVEVIVSKEKTPKFKSWIQDK